MDVRVGPQRRLSTKELMLLNCDPGEDSLDCSLEGTDAEAVAPILWPPDVKSWLTAKDSDAGKDWRQEEEGDDRGWDGWMASVTQRTWVWANSRKWWRTGKPGLLPSTESKRVRHNLATQQQQRTFIKDLSRWIVLIFLGIYLGVEFWSYGNSMFHILRNSSNQTGYTI